jgi:hypothetical protein
MCHQQTDAVPTVTLDIGAEEDVGIEIIASKDEDEEKEAEAVEHLGRVVAEDGRMVSSRIGTPQPHNGHS